MSQQKHSSIIAVSLLAVVGSSVISHIAESVFSHTQMTFQYLSNLLRQKIKNLHEHSLFS